MTVKSPKKYTLPEKAVICGAVVKWLVLLHYFIQIILNLGSALVQTLLTACWRFAMVRISDYGPG